MKLADWLDALTHKNIHRTDPTLGSVPVGMLASFPSTIPSGWLLCDGGSFSSTDYPALQTYLGGTTLPNYKGMVLVMRDAAQAEFDTLGETGGAKTVALVSAEMPSHGHIQDAHGHTQNGHNHSQDSHGHGVTDPTHEHAADGDYGNRYAVTVGGSTHKLSTTGDDQNLDFTDIDANSTGVSVNGSTAINQGATATNQNTTATNQTTGTGNAHNNLQPYKVVNVAIRAA